MAKNIIEISSECSGIAQRGGLGSVIWGISDAFHKTGHQVTIIMPYYEEIRHEVRLFATIPCSYGGAEIPVPVYETMHVGIRVFLIHSEQFFRGEYADVYIDSGKLQRGYFEDDAKRFAFFSLAACHLLLQLQQKEKINVIHCHDWHTGLIPLLIKVHPAFKLLLNIYRLFTVHNLEYQGTRPFAPMGDLKAFLDWYPALAEIEPEIFAAYLDPHADIPCINPMRAALYAADRVTTVSPSYAAEICQKDSPETDFLGGRGLEEDFAKLLQKGRLAGIVNGIDVDYYTPKNLQEPYAIKTRADGAKRNRTALFQDMETIIDGMIATHSLIGGSENALRAKLRDWRADTFTGRPLFVAVTRLTGQKIQLFFETLSGKTVLKNLEQREINLIFLGKGDLMPQLAAEIQAAPNMLLFGGFDDELEKRLYAAADCMLMPSEFEPCGTSQMKAMRYGCLPIAAQVGGLGDTIRHGHNGFLFSGKTRREKADAFMGLMDYSIDLIVKSPKKFLKLQQNAMKTDFSWTDAAGDYLKLMKK